MNNQPSRFRISMAAIVILGIGILMGRLSLDATTGIAQDRRQDDNDRRTFRSASERSEEVLRSIDETLKRIETKVEGIETAVKNGQDDD